MQQKLTARTSDLRISLSVLNDSVRVALAGRTEKLGPWESDYSPGDFKDARRQLTTHFSDFRDAVGDALKPGVAANSGDYERLRVALRDLLEHGKLMLLRLAGRNRFQRVIDFCVKARISARLDGRSPLVILEAPLRLMLPVEMMPLWGALSDIPPITSLETLRNVCTLFPGFSGEVARVLPPSEDWVRPPLEIAGSPKISVRMFHDARLKHAADEGHIFGPSSEFTSTGPWPGSESELERMAEFYELFWDQHAEHQIHHFCCHFYAPEPLDVAASGGRLRITPELLPDDSYLELSSVGGQNTKISLQQINSKFIDFDGQLPRPTGASIPLVFLNACGGSHVEPGGVASFPKIVLDFGYRSFIGTEVKIPDQFASSFARRFYVRLLQDKWLSQALLEAKLDMVTMYANPLGILYSGYGEPDLYVSRFYPTGFDQAGQPNASVRVR